MRTPINTVANVTTTRIANRQVRTVVAGVDALRSAPRHLRLYNAAAHAAPAPQQWDHANDHKSFAGKQKPAGTGSMPGGSDLSRCSRRESSRCRRPRVSSWLARS